MSALRQAYTAACARVGDLEVVQGRVMQQLEAIERDLHEAKQQARALHDAALDERRGALKSSPEQVLAAIQAAGADLATAPPVPDKPAFDMSEAFPPSPYKPDDAPKDEP